MDIFGGTKNGTWGARIKIPPLKPLLRHFGTILDPGKVIFGHFIFLVIFPLKFPFKQNFFYQHGKELSYRVNKICSETSEAMRTTWEHAHLISKTFLNKNPPTLSAMQPQESLLLAQHQMSAKARARTTTKTKTPPPPCTCSTVGTKMPAADDLS